MQRYISLFILVGVLVVSGVTLWLMGRVPICTCGYVKLWQGNIWSSENSQHLTDWYTFSHIIHGFIFYYLVRKCIPKLPCYVQFALALLLEAAWEILENSPIIINRYRESTISLDYYGDSVINSLSDIASMAGGYWVASRLSGKTILIAALIMELGVGYMIRDNLTLNVLMLIYPSPLVKEFQMKLAPAPSLEELKPPTEN